jgi:NAD(P)-dependent dehydrogenase (short-subunit alcohol dehydrogenase family)
MDKPMVIVTGASRGIGAAIARHLAEAGFTIACLSRSGGLPAAPEELAARFIPYAVDVTDAEAMASVIDQAVKGRVLAGIVNNAGQHTEAASATLSIADWNAQMAINATAVLIGCQAAFPHMTGAGGLIVNIGSFFDKIGVKRNLAYCASKAAVGAMTRVLAVEWAKQGIAVLDVAPGYIVTDLNRETILEGPLRAYLEKRIPGGEPGTADDVGRLVASLYGLNLGFLSGETIYIDGAQGVAH